MKFEGNCYLKKSYLSQHGSKDVVFAFDAQQAVEIAKLELMGRDFADYTPRLLKLVVTIAPETNGGTIEKQGTAQKVFR